MNAGDFWVVIAGMVLPYGTNGWSTFSCFSIDYKSINTFAASFCGANSMDARNSWVIIARLIQAKDTMTITYIGISLVTTTRHQR
ncbi:hypothetical protein R50072_06520 [Simiduia litorea]|uniref:hypothetical protein n=1 Tax=Simiduia litorea TaxID=1435348 RepID=UPI0036F39C90